MSGTNCGVKERTFEGADEPGRPQTLVGGAVMRIRTTDQELVDAVVSGQPLRGAEAGSLTEIAVGKEELRCRAGSVKG